jgi:hypothetical protein
MFFLLVFNLGLLADFFLRVILFQFEYKVVICGNHEAELSRTHTPQQIRERLTSATHYLHHEAATIAGLRIFGSPHTNFGPADKLKVPLGPEMAAKWQEIPTDVDIVMTHMPCLGIMDLANGTADGFFRDTAGHAKPPPPPAEYASPCLINYFKIIVVCRIVLCFFFFFPALLSL